jgi:hypothetical protein
MSGGVEEIYNIVNMREALFRTKTLTVSNERANELSPTYNSFWEIILTAKRKKSVIGCNIEVR